MSAAATKPTKETASPPPRPSSHADAAQPQSRLRVAVIGARPGATVELAPGQRFAAVDAGDMPKICVAEMVPAGGGTFKMMARVLPKEFTNSNRNLRLLGIPLSVDTMQRLIKTGFIQGHQETPQLYVFNYDSYLEFKTQCQAGEFWTPERRKIYSTYISY
jgi:hypothetical protein